MKTALLHFWLLHMRGGEKVFAQIADMYPDADIYTHAFAKTMWDREVSGGGASWRGHPVHESFIASLPYGRRMPQMYLPLMPGASRSLDLDGSELVISSESGPIKGIRKPRGSRHVCYCHTPMRYLWDLYDDYYRASGRCGKLAMRMFRDRLRSEDLRSADSVDAFIANSDFVAERIRRIYGREATVVHPMVDYDFFSSAVGRMTRSDSGYYLFVGQLVPYKLADLAIAACRKQNRRLKIIGSGPQASALMRLAAGDDRIEFLGHVSDEELRTAYANARALLFPGVEDFGIVPLEAQAAGVPVVAYGRGGVLETVVGNGGGKDATGVFFGNQSVESLCGAMEELEGHPLSPDACRANAARFNPAAFRESFRSVVDRVCRG